MVLNNCLRMGKDNYDLQLTIDLMHCINWVHSRENFTYLMHQFWFVNTFLENKNDVHETIFDYLLITILQNKTLDFFIEKYLISK